MKDILKEFDENFNECENDGCNMFVNTRQYKEVKQFLMEKISEVILELVGEEIENDCFLCCKHLKCENENCIGRRNINEYRQEILDKAKKLGFLKEKCNPCKLENNIGKCDRKDCINY